MIRSRTENYSDEEFLAIVEPHSKEIEKYLDNIIYDFIAFYFASGYKLDALFDGNLRGHINSAIEYFNAVKYLNNYDIKRIEKILKVKYSLIITNNSPMAIKEKI